MYKKKTYKNKYQSGMQKIKKTRWPARNIGGDRAYAKLRYVVGQNFGIGGSVAFNAQNLAFGIGASSIPAVQAVSINGVFGNTPGLSTMGSLYLYYRIRGIKLKLTYWQTAGTPVVLFTNANSSSEPATIANPVPDFVTPAVNVLPEQRWARYKTCSQTQNGGRPTVLNSYYSVNKVFGPDSVVKNDKSFVGEMQVATPYFSIGTDSNSQPTFSPYLEFGLLTMNGQPVVEPVNTGVLKIEATVYTEFFGKRIKTE